MTPKEVMALCRKKDVKVVDLRFTDLFGQWRHLSIPVDKLDEDLFDDGIGIAGANIVGWETSKECDMLVVPQPETVFIDPFSSLPTLVVLGNVVDPTMSLEFDGCPRNIAQKAQNYLMKTEIADTAFFGSQIDFHVFDQAKFSQSPNRGFFDLETAEAQSNDALQGRSGRSDTNSGYLCTPPTDQLLDVRSNMVQTMIDCGLDLGAQFHASGSLGQSTIGLRHKTIVEMGDAVMTYKYIVRNVARKHDKAATFMPKPILGQNASSMRVHFSLWKDESSLFSGSGYAGLSDIALYALGGILRHAPAIHAFTNPTTNSYKRFVPGFNAPLYLTYSKHNQSAACRLPMHNASPDQQRIEFRSPDPTCNPYLAFSAILLAAIDGIQNKLDPGEPADFDQPRDSETFTDYTKAPSSLQDALDSLAADHEFLLRGEVFTSEIISTWIDLKRTHEVEALRMRPHPYEFCLYFDQ